MSVTTHRDSALALFEAVGRLLNAGNGMEATLAGVAGAVYFAAALALSLALLALAVRFAAARSERESP